MQSRLAQQDEAIQEMEDRTTHLTDELKNVRWMGRSTSIHIMPTFVVVVIKDK